MVRKKRAKKSESRVVLSKNKGLVAVFRSVTASLNTSEAAEHDE